MYCVSYVLHFNDGKMKENIVTTKTKEDAMKLIDTKAQTAKAKAVSISGLTYYAKSLESKFY